MVDEMVEILLSIRNWSIPYFYCCFWLLLAKRPCICKFRMIGCVCLSLSYFFVVDERRRKVSWQGDFKVYVRIEVKNCIYSFSSLWQLNWNGTKKKLKSADSRMWIIYQSDGWLKEWRRGGCLLIGVAELAESRRQPAQKVASVLPSNCLAWIAAGWKSFFQASHPLTGPTQIWEAFPTSTKQIQQVKFFF